MKRFFSVILLSLAWCSVASSESYMAKVIGVSDGDTVTVLREKTPVKIRLNGIDCPETGQDFGSKAKELTSGLVFGQSVRVIRRDTDRYGRTVADLFLPDGRMLNWSAQVMPGGTGSMLPMTVRSRSSKRKRKRRIEVSGLSPERSHLGSGEVLAAASPLLCGSNSSAIGKATFIIALAVRTPRRCRIRIECPSIRPLRRNGRISGWKRLLQIVHRKCLPIAESRPRNRRLSFCAIFLIHDNTTFRNYGITETRSDSSPLRDAGLAPLGYDLGISGTEFSDFASSGHFRTQIGLAILHLRRHDFPQFRNSAIPQFRNSAILYFCIHAWSV